MTLRKLWTIAFRDLGRNKRRSIFTLIAVGLGLALLIFMSGYIAGTVDSVVQNGIDYQTGHLQLRADSYEEEKVSLLWGDLLENPDGLAEEARQTSRVEAASPVLWSSGVLSTIRESVGIQFTGIDPNSDVHQPFRDSVTDGEFVSADQRGGIVIGEKLAREMGVGVGQRVSLLIGHSDGRPEESVVTIQGLFSTGVGAFDNSSVLMALPQAQRITGAGDRASAIVLLLQEKEDADQVATSLAVPGLSTHTWEEMNSLVLQAIESGLGFYYIMYGIVILVVAVLIANTLLMAVFERTREMGILAALGMKGRQIMLMFLLEAVVLALMGIALGIVLGTIIVVVISQTGIPIGDLGDITGDFAIGSSLYTKFVPIEIFFLSLATLIIILLAAVIPARYASKLEPVAALRAL